MTSQQKELQQGDKAFAEGDYALAEAKYRQAVVQQPGDVNPQLKLALVLERTKRVAQAIKLLESVLTDRPQEYSVLNNLGILYESSGKYEQATALFRQAVAARRTDITAYNNLALRLVESGDYCEAADVLSKALSIDNKNVMTLVTLATAQLAQNNVEAAVDALDRVRIDQTDFSQSLGAAMTYHSCSIKSQNIHLLSCSRQYVKRCLSMRPLNVVSWFLTLNIYYTRAMLALLNWKRQQA